MSQAFSTPKLNLPIHLTQEAYKSNGLPSSSSFPPKITNRWNIIQAGKGNWLILVILHVPWLVWIHDLPLAKNRPQKDKSPLQVYRFIGRVDWNFVNAPKYYCALFDPLINMIPNHQHPNYQFTLGWYMHNDFSRFIKCPKDKIKEPDVQSKMIAVNPWPHTKEKQVRSISYPTSRRYGDITTSL